MFTNNAWEFHTEELGQKCTSRSLYHANTKMIYFHQTMGWLGLMPHWVYGLAPLELQRILECFLRRSGFMSPTPRPCITS